MSYILEALKKAEAERNRGGVPDLHAQANALTAAYDDDPAPPARPWLWAVAGAAVVLAALLAWRLGSSEPPPAAVPSTPPSPLPVPPPASPPPAATPAPVPTPAQTPASNAQPAPVPAPQPAPPPPKPAPAAPKAKVPPPARTAPKPAPAAAQAAGSRPTTATAPKDAVPAAPAPAAARIPTLNELPDDVRRQVPPLAIAGAVYSPQAANRMVIVNGLVAREGTPIAAGVVLEQIGPKSAVFSVRGQRFELPIQGQ